MYQPLAGLRVVDLSRVLAGPWASQILADLGAEVIKIEHPGAGDDTRSWGPPYVAGRSGDEAEFAAYYLAANRGKKSLALDIKTKEGQAIVRGLAANADIFLENFKKDGLKKYGLDYENLQQINPRLIYCSITGFGQTGPYSAYAGYDFVVQAMSGLMSVTGQPNGSSGAEPMKTGIAVADLATGLYSVIAILAALQGRAKSGKGCAVDMALFDVMLALMSNQAMNYLVGGKAPQALGNSHPNIVPYQAFETKNGHLVLAIGNDGQFQHFCEIALGAEGEKWAKDPRFRRNRDRVLNRKALLEWLVPLMKTRSTEDWNALFARHAIPAGPVYDLAEAFCDPQAQMRGLSFMMEGESLSGEKLNLPSLGIPILYKSDDGDAFTRPIADRAPPRLGADSRAILQAEGLSDGQIDKLLQAGIIKI